MFSAIPLTQTLHSHLYLRQLYHLLLNPLAAFVCQKMYYAISVFLSPLLRAGMSQTLRSFNQDSEPCSC